MRRLAADLAHDVGGLPGGAGALRAVENLVARLVAHAAAQLFAQRACAWVWMMMCADEDEEEIGRGEREGERERINNKARIQMNGMY